MKKDEKVIVFTIIASNYLNVAKLLVESYKRQHPDHSFFVLFVDNQKTSIKSAESVNANELTNIPNLIDLEFKYDITEFSTALKPFFAEWLLLKYNPEKILYFDPDIYVYRPISLILDKLDMHDCVLIPHVTTPYNDDKNPTELDIMKVGLYNLGFVGFKNSKDTNQFLHWWQSKLINDCYNDPENYIFTDQKQMDFAPVYLNTYIVREKGFDVAYWNLHEYINLVNTNEVVFFHFSGYVVGNESISKYQNRYSLSSIGEYKTLFIDYTEKIQLTKKSESQVKYKYPYNYFSNGEPISTSIRRIYGNLTNDKIRLNNPFDIGPNSFYEYLSSYRTDGIPNLVYDLFQTKKSLQREYQNIEFAENDYIYQEYITWLLNFGYEVYGIPKSLLNKIRLHYKKTLGLKTSFNSLVNYLFQHYEGETFITKAYNFLLKREPDEAGVRRNMEVLRKGKLYKYLILYRIIYSSEFKSKNKFFPQKSSYLFFISAVACVLGGLEKIKKKLHQNNVVCPFGINVIGYIDTESGVGESARGIIRALNKSTIPFSIYNIEQPWLRRSNKEFSNQFSSSLPYSINLLCVNADQLENVVKNHLPKNSLKHKYNIGYWYWESNIFPQEYHTAFKYINELWVATKYLRDVLSKYTNIAVNIIPPAFAEDDMNDRFDFIKNKINIKKNDFVFLNIFDSNSFWQRKNPFGLIKSFKRAFNSDDHVKLIIKTTNISKSEVFDEIIKETTGTKNIILIDKYLSDEEIGKLINACDCYISLHRSEGLGIPLVEAMLNAKPVIATGFGGNVDFMNENNSYLVTYNQLIIDKNIGPYLANSNWADASIDDAVAKMRYVKSHQKAAANQALRGKEDISLLFNPSRIAKLITDRVMVLKKVS